MIEEIFSFDNYKTFINNVSKNSNLKDPHFEYDDKNLYDSLSDKNEKAYITKKGTKITGIYVWSIIPEDKYIEMIIGLSNEENSLEEMLSFIEAKYKGYKFDFVINPHNINFVNILKSRKAFFENEQEWMLCECKNNVNELTEFEVIELTQDYHRQYIEKHNRDVYWTAEKIISSNDIFQTFLAIKDDKVIGYIDVTHCYEKNEIYDLWIDGSFKEQGYEQALLQKAINMNAPNKMQILVDVNDKTSIGIYLSLGFVKISGTNCIYATYINKDI